MLLSRDINVFHILTEGGCSGQTLLTNAEGEIIVGSDEYGNEMSCQWLIRAPTGSVRLADLLTSDTSI